MNSLNRITILLTAATFALAMAGCGHKEGDGHAHAEGGASAGHGREHEPGVSFSAKSGLLVPPETSKFIGLQVADIEERKVASSFRFTAVVYRTTGEAQLASTRPVAVPSAGASARVGLSEAALLSEGQAVTVVVDGGDALAARVTQVNHEVAKASGQAEVLLAITDDQARLVKGSFVTVSVPLGGEKSVVSVPRSALLRTVEGHFIYTVSGNRFVRAAVKLGLVNHEFAEVTDGLYAGDQIVVQPVMTLWLAELQSIRGGKACADGH